MVCFSPICNHYLQDKKSRRDLYVSSGVNAIMSFTQTACRLSPSKTGIRLNETTFSTLLPGEDDIDAFVSAFAPLKLNGISVSSAVSSLTAHNWGK